MANLIVMNVVVRSNRINTIVATQVRPADGQVIYFDVQDKIEHNVKFRTVHQNQVMNRRIDW
jgi:hypothetical protein